MLNDLILVGRLTRDIEVYKTESGRQLGRISLAVARSFKNIEGTYDTDFIPCLVWEEKARIASTYCHKGDIIGIRGRLQSRVIETDEGKRNLIEVIAERISFLSSHGKNVKENDNTGSITIEK
mgnify:FL=1